MITRVFPLLGHVLTLLLPRSSTWLLRSSRSRRTTARLTGGVWDRCSTRCSMDSSVWLQPYQPVGSSSGAHWPLCCLQPPFYSRNTAEMYNNILHKSPVLKPNVSNAGRDLLEGLLQKERTKRLGVKDDFVSLDGSSQHVGHGWSLHVCSLM